MDAVRVQKEPARLKIAENKVVSDNSNKIQPVCNLQEIHSGLLYLKQTAASLFHPL